MVFLLDANVLIDAARDYYPLEMVPEFWEWLAHNGSVGHIKMPIEIYEEVCTAASRPTRQRANRHVPDVCKGLGLSCCNTFEMTRRLGFRTSWRAPR
jgi:hypothetical protein